MSYPLSENQIILIADLIRTSRSRGKGKIQYTVPVPGQRSGKTVVWTIDYPIVTKHCQDIRQAEVFLTTEDGSLQIIQTVHELIHQQDLVVLETSLERLVRTAGTRSD